MASSSKLAESEGELALNGEVIARSDGGRYILRSADSADLRLARAIDLIAYGPMTLTASARLARGQVVDHRGQVREEVVLRRVDGRASVSIDEGMVPFKIRLSEA